MFKEGEHVQIEIPDLNLQHGAGEEYPHLGTGTVGAVDSKEAVLLREHEHYVPVILDYPFLRRRNKDVVSPWRPVVVKKEEVTELAVPCWLLKSTKEQGSVLTLSVSERIRAFCSLSLAVLNEDR